MIIFGITYVQLPPCSVDKYTAHEQEFLIPVSRFCAEDIQDLLGQMLNFSTSFPPSSLPASLPRYCCHYLGLRTLTDCPSPVANSIKYKKLRCATTPIMDTQQGQGPLG
jgi:hypothetical protein